MYAGCLVDPAVNQTVFSGFLVAYLVSDFLPWPLAPLLVFGLLIALRFYLLESRYCWPVSITGPFWQRPLLMLLLLVISQLVTLTPRPQVLTTELG